jgi:hypothetical protein
VFDQVVRLIRLNIFVMRAQEMIKHSNGGHPLLRDVQEELTRRYPYLKIETSVIQIPGLRRTSDGPVLPEKASGDDSTDDWLDQKLALSDTTTVQELEEAIAALFGVSAQVFRGSGKFWIETRMTRAWTLKQQNDQGSALAAGL